MMSEKLANNRAQQVLKVLVECYIQDGHPVASKTIAEESALGLSSATIRNILVNLEACGYLRSPHTSAGRIPTTKGYRCFVNELMSLPSLDSHEIEGLKQGLDPEMAMPDLLKRTSCLLSGMTQLIGIVALPAQEEKSTDYVLTGQEYLFQYFSEVHLLGLKHLFEAFTQKEDILDLLSHSIEAEGIQVYIGQESGHELLNDWSVVAMPYSVKGKLQGSLGVLGPLRMPYHKVISAVDTTSKLLSAALNQD